MSDFLKDKVAIVTSRSCGIGGAIPEKFAQEGCNLMLASRTKSELEKTTESIQKQLSIGDKFLGMYTIYFLNSINNLILYFRNLDIINIKYDNNTNSF
jgi:NADP-dependent 3-hydroxy acid dehydrogenase YdfG